MIEFTFGELVLFAWAVLATGAAFKFKDKADMSAFVLRKMVEDEEVRAKILRDFEEFKAREARGEA